MKKKNKSSASIGPTRPSKRRVARKVLLQATGFRSGYEKRVTDDLTKREIAYSYESVTFTYPFPIRGSKCVQCGSPATRTGRYTPDLKFDNGSFCETKGKLTSANRTRLVAFRAARPDITLRILFQADNWLTSKHKQRYTDWAKSAGFECAVGDSVPLNWTWAKFTPTTKEKDG